MDLPAASDVQPVEEWLRAGALEPDVVVEVQVVPVPMPRVDLQLLFVL